MAEPATSRQSAEQPVNGVESGDGRMGELRRLLVGPELSQIARLQTWLDDPETRAEDLNRILRSEGTQKYLEKMMWEYYRRDPKRAAAAVAPIILPSVMTLIEDKFRAFAENLSQIAEKSISPRALLWRLEAVRTGKKFTDILLARSLLYSVRQVFLIDRKTGVLLQDVERKAVAKDPDMISSMLSAIQDFIRDSIVGSANQELDEIGMTSFKLWIQHGQRILVAGAVEGTPPMELKAVFRSAREDVEKEFAAELGSFQGDVSPFEKTRPILERCLLGQSGPKPRKPVLAWVLAGVAVLALVSWGALTIVRQQRWDRYLQTLSATPGIVITQTEMHGSEYVVDGFRDPQAQDPAALLRGTRVPIEKVRFRLEPYLSLAPQFVAAREYAAQKSAIESYIIRFALGKADVREPELDMIDDIAARVDSLRGTAKILHRSFGIEVTGHTDELGAEELNQHLSKDRAEHAAEALVAAGVDRSLLVMRGVLTSEPVRRKSSERDRIYNRSVSFRVKDSP